MSFDILYDDILCNILRHLTFDEHRRMMFMDKRIYACVRKSIKNCIQNNIYVPIYYCGAMCLVNIPYHKILKRINSATYKDTYMYPLIIKCSYAHELSAELAVEVKNGRKCMDVGINHMKACSEQIHWFTWYFDDSYKGICHPINNIVYLFENYLCEIYDALRDEKYI